jgi:transcriptional regulator with XRE-family HTH domain
MRPRKELIMELEFEPLTKPLSDHSFQMDVDERGASNESHQGSAVRAKTSLRIRYEAEVQVIKRKLGNLEDIRKTLGLSQRKISQLLFVDPSAWTRWTKGGDEAPPHIYRMLQWYLALEDKYPALDTGFWLSTVARISEPARNQLLERELKDLQMLERQAIDRKTDQISAEIQVLSNEQKKIRENLAAQQRRTIWVLILVSSLACAVGIAIGAFFRG